MKITAEIFLFILITILSITCFSCDDLNLWELATQGSQNIDKDITQFTIMGINGTIGANTVDLTVPFGTDRSNLTPTITITGVSVNPASGVPQNFNVPVQYTVTAADATQKIYTVTVSVAPTVGVSNIGNDCQLETGFVIGTAAGGTGTIAAVEVSFDGGAYINAIGTTTWKMAVPYGGSTWKKGTQHTINVRSRDNAGIYSAVVSTTVRKGTNKDVNGDGYADLGVGAIEWVLNGTDDNTGRAYIYHGSASGAALSPATTITGDAPGNHFGHSMTFGDLNGDGYADFIVGSMHNSSSDFWGKVHVYYGSPSGITATTAAAAGFILLSESDEYWSFSSSLATSDTNNDGYDDLAVGNYDMGIDSRVHIFHGSPSGLAGSSPRRPSIPLGDIIITGNFIGSSIAFGDVNGDGYQDIAIGAFLDNSGTGRVYIIHGTSGGIPGGDVTVNEYATFIGQAAGNNLGKSVALGDINGDGYADLVMGAYGFNGNQGRVYIYYGSFVGISSPLVDIATDADLFIDGLTSSSQGWQVALGDANKDGSMDLGISALDCNSGNGRVFVYLGSGGGLTTPSDKAYTGTSQLGWAIGFTDLNGDGFSDLVATEPNYNRLFIYNGSPTGTSPAVSKTINGDPDSWFATSLTPNAGIVW